VLVPLLALGFTVAGAAAAEADAGALRSFSLAE
jgi:hypothetical protein